MVWSADFPYRSDPLRSQGKKGLDCSTGDTYISFYLVPQTASGITHAGLALANTSRQRVVIFMSGEESDCTVLKSF